MITLVRYVILESCFFYNWLVFGPVMWIRIRTKSPPKNLILKGSENSIWNFFFSYKYLPFFKINTVSTGTYRIQLFTKLFLYLLLSGQIFTTWIRIRITTCGFIYNCFEQPQQIQQLCTFTVGKLDYPKFYALPTETHHPSSCFRSGWQDISRSTRACSNHSRLVQI